MAAAQTLRAARFDDHVADLAGEAVAAADELAVRDDAAADAGAEGHHDKVVDTASRPPLVFGERGAVGVVLTEHHRTAERLAEQRPQVGARRALQIGSERQASVSTHEPR